MYNVHVHLYKCLFQIEKFRYMCLLYTFALFFLLYRLQVRCSKVGDLPSCGALCGKDLTCGRHVCESVCHPAPCLSCCVFLTVECHCKREKRETVCGETQELEFSCAQTCGK